MALIIISERLAPTTPGQPHTYAVQTTTEIRLPGQVLQQRTSSLLRYTVTEVLPGGHQLVELLTLQMQAPPTAGGLVELLLDIARANSPLQVEVDELGQLRRVLNKSVLANQWRELLPWLQAKHRATPGALELFGQVATQFADNNQRLEQALANKGVYGMVLPGLWGLRPVGGDTRTDCKTLHQFFKNSALPLLVDWQTTSTEVLDQTAEITGTGRLDSARFDHAAFQQHLDELTGPLPRPPALQVAWAERYTVSRTGQGILMGEQTLRVGIPGVYEHNTRHTIGAVATTSTAQL
ncbi:MAG: hypothetical protein EOO63_00715 [Hymenobacter sp.]|nr:MAG: hypothetical protein EOO63_00715 [Hymenobacter sp.]